MHRQQTGQSRCAVWGSGEVEGKEGVVPAGRESVSGTLHRDVEVTLDTLKTLIGLQQPRNHFLRGATRQTGSFAKSLGSGSINFVLKMSCIFWLFRSKEPEMATTVVKT